MKRLPGRDFNWEEITFEWDRHNQPKLAQEAPYTKSGRPPVYPQEAEEVFYNPNVIRGPHTVKRERRYYIWGVTDSARQLFMGFVVKGTQSRLPTVRIFHARDMEPREARAYLNAVEEEYDAKEEE